MAETTPLYDLHQKAGARFVDFAGYLMPVHYGSQIEEHLAVRRGAGLFDVSHMGILDVEGPGATAFLRQALANDVGRIRPGRALYSCLLNDRGGVVDDLVVYALAGGGYRVVLNAARKAVDQKHLAMLAASYPVTLTPRPDLGLLALQGPEAVRALPAFFGDALAGRLAALRSFAALETELGFVGRTGYTGEDGFEIALPADLLRRAFSTWIESGVRPAGLGARDTLRLEAGLNLYGQDMDESTSPLESNLAWTVAFEPPERDFAGRAALEAERREGGRRSLVGIYLAGAGVLRAHQDLVDADGRIVGTVTSGSYAPSLGFSIGLARIVEPQPETAWVVIRDRRHPVRWHHPPFVRRGHVLVPAAAGR